MKSIKVGESAKHVDCHYHFSPIFISVSNLTTASGICIWHLPKLTTLAPNPAQSFLKPSPPTNRRPSVYTL